MFPIMPWQISAVSAGTWVLHKFIFISIERLEKMDIKVVTFDSFLHINITLTLDVFVYSSWHKFGKHNLVVHITDHHYHWKNQIVVKNLRIVAQ